MAKTADDKEEKKRLANEKKRKKMSRELGIDLDQAQAILDGKAPTGSSSSSAVDPVAKFLKAEGTAVPVVDSSSDDDNIMVDKDMKAGDILVSGAIDFENVGRQVTTGDLTVPHRMKFPKQIKFVASSSASNHSIFIDVSGHVYVWGKNDSGQLGLGDLKTRYKPVKLEHSSRFIGAATGKAFTLLLSTNGIVYGMGSNKCGQLGTGNTKDSTIPIEMDSAAGTITKVACGAEFSALLNKHGQVYMCGHPGNGQLGNNTNGEYIQRAGKVEYHFVKRPEPVMGYLLMDERKTKTRLSGVVIADIACGKNHTVALEKQPADGSAAKVFTWGCAGYGRLGHRGVTSDEMVPLCVQQFLPMYARNTKIAKISAGGRCSLAISDRGLLYWWGILPNSKSGEAQTYPKDVEDLYNFATKSVAAGSDTILACAESTTTGWGVGQSNELGFGADGPKSSSKPKFIETLDGFINYQVTCGSATTIFISKNDDAEDAEYMAKLPEIDLTDEKLLELGILEEQSEVEPPKKKAKKAAPAKGGAKGKKGKK